MVRFSEMLGNNKATEVTKLRDFGALSFGKRKNTDKNEDSTPHYEFEKGYEMYEDNPIVASALDQLILFLFPNKKIKISSEDKKTKEFLEEWCKMRPNLINEFKNILLTNLITGNGPSEKRWAKTTDGKVVLDNVFASNDMVRIYINPDVDEKGENAYFFKLPVGIKSFRYMGENITPGYFQITYIKNYQYTFQREWGFFIPKYKMEIYQSGFSRFGIYGRAGILSAIDGHNIYKEIISSWDTIARTRQLDQKILTVTDGTNPIDISQDRLEELGTELENNDKSYILFNTPLKFVQQDIGVSGNYDLMEGVFDLVRRMIIMGLLPQHLTPWSDSATTQGSEAAMPPFMARIKSKQNEFSVFLKGIIIDTLRMTYPWIAEDAEFDIDEPKILADDIYINTITRLKDSGIVSLKQSAEYLDKLDIIEMDEEFIKKQGDRNDRELDVNFSKETTEALKESVKQANVGFNVWKGRLKVKEPMLNTSDWREAKKVNIGGKDLRIIESTDSWLIYEGLNLINTFNKKVTKKLTVAQAFKDYKDYLIKIQEEFESGESEEDNLINELNKIIGNEYEKRFNKVLKHLDKSEVNKESFQEGFLSKIIFGKIDDSFKGFSTFISIAVGKILSKLNAETIDDKVNLNTKDRDLLKKKNTLMVKNIKDNVKTLKDDVARGIKNDLTQGITAGRQLSDIKSDLEKRFNYKGGVGYRFDRAVHKNLRTSANLLKLQKWLKMGFEEYEWITRGDSKVRPKHAERNRRVYKIRDALNGDDIFPGSEFGCRCRAVMYN